MRLDALSPLGHTFGPISDCPLSGTPDVRCRERVNIGCLLLTSAVAGAQTADTLEACLSTTLPRSPGAVTFGYERIAIWLSPRSWLFLCDPVEEAELVGLVADRFPDRLAHASAFSDFLCWLSLEGHRAEDVLRQGSFISLARSGLPRGHAKRTLIDGIPAVVFHEEAEVWRVAVERSRAVHFRNWLDSLTLD